MKPRIAISMGDPGGVGPEVILKSLAREDVRDALSAVVVGDARILQQTADQLGIPADINVIPQMAGPTQTGDNLVSVFEPLPHRADFTVGGIGEANGAMSHAYITSAAKAVLAKDFDALCTAPIAKEALFKAGFTVPGHTELLADISGGHPVRMMLAGGGLRVVLQTIHVALKDVPSLLSPSTILESLRMIASFSAGVGLRNPRIAVCGLNPHAGESGHFGTEELETISPAVTAAIAEGIDATGPLPADTVFHNAVQGEYDFVLAMYHDQGLIPVKTLDFHGGVNVTLGLPLLRTSPDHGTAFNIAGRGIANESSMVSALKYAANLAQGRL